MIAGDMIAIYVLGGAVLLLLLWSTRLEIRLKAILRGGNGKSLEASIVDTKQRVDVLAQFRKEMEAYLERVEQRLRRSAQGIETVRFNPFKGTGDGGNQSFAVAFLNENGDGAVLSSLYARERMSVYAKPVRQYGSEFELTEEERRAIQEAKQTINQ